MFNRFFLRREIDRPGGALFIAREPWSTGLIGGRNGGNMFCCDHHLSYTLNYLTPCKLLLTENFLGRLEHLVEPESKSYCHSPRSDPLIYAQSLTPKLCGHRSTAPPQKRCRQPRPWRTSFYGLPWRCLAGGVCISKLVVCRIA